MKCKITIKKYINAYITNNILKICILYIIYTYIHWKLLPSPTNSPIYLAWRLWKLPLWKSELTYIWLTNWLEHFLPVLTWDLTCAPPTTIIRRCFLGKTYFSLTSSLSQFWDKLRYLKSPQWVKYCVVSSTERSASLGNCLDGHWAGRPSLILVC